MTREELFRAVGEVREDQIAEHFTRCPWKRYGALAACLVAVLAGVFGWNRLYHTGWDLPFAGCCGAALYRLPSGHTSKKGCRRHPFFDVCPLILGCFFLSPRRSAILFSS